MTFTRLNKAAELKTVVFTDASLGNIKNWTGSTGTYIVWLMDNTGQCCPIAWNAHKIKCVVRSSLAAETLSLEEGLEASFYYREMLGNILGLETRTITTEASLRPFYLLTWLRTSGFEQIQQLSRNHSSFIM